MIEPPYPGHWYRATIAIDPNIVFIPERIITIPPEPEEETRVILAQITDGFLDLFLYSAESIPPSRRNLETLGFHYLPGILEALTDVLGEIVFSVLSNSLDARCKIPIIGTIYLSDPEDDSLPF